MQLSCSEFGRGVAKGEQLLMPYNKRFFEDSLFFLGGAGKIARLGEDRSLTERISDPKGPKLKP